MSEKWTPGPWFAEQDQHFGPGWVVTAPNGGMQNRCPVVRIQSPAAGLDDVDAQDKADAHLIAAAPDMARALQDIIQQVEREPYITPDVTRAEEALQKARGESQ